MVHAMVGHVLSMSHDSFDKTNAVETHGYRPEAEPEVIALLQGAFGPGWGDGAFWRWKHADRPGFSPLDVRIYRFAGRLIGCWHMAQRNVRLGPGLEIAASVEGDYAMHPDFRGVGMGRDAASLREVRALAERGIVARFGFTSSTLFERVYRPKLGYRRIRAVTSHYRKLISDKGVQERLRVVGERLRAQGVIQKLVREAPLTVRIDVPGFSPCQLVIEQNSSHCGAVLDREPDLAVRLPLLLLSLRSSVALRAALAALLTGRVRIRHAMRFVRRGLGALVR